MSKKAEDMIPFLTIASANFEKDLEIVKQILGQYEKRTHSENAYIFSPRPEMAAGWWFYDVLVTRDVLQKIFQTILPDGFCCSLVVLAHEMRRMAIQALD